MQNTLLAFTLSMHQTRHAALVALALLLPLHAMAEPSLVVLVRHAEKSTQPADDPALSAAGQQRALALAQALQHAGITAIITTQFRRTRDTAAPLATQLGLQPQVITARRGESVAPVVAAIRQQTGTVLVVGHSNTVPQIALALGGPTLPDLCETTYGLALVLRPRASDAPLLRLRYGAADAEPQPSCQ